MAADAPLTVLASRLANIPDPVALLGSLFALAPVAFQVFSADGRSLLVNPAFLALFGSEPPPEYSVLHDDIAATTGNLDLIRRAFGGETVHVPTTWYDPRELKQVKVTEGRKVAVEATFFPLRDGAGSVTHVAAIFADRTELETERELLHAIIEQSAEGIIVADVEGNIRIFNQAAERQHGVRVRDVPAKNWASTFGLLAPDGTELTLEQTPLHQALRGADVVDARWLVRRPDGDVRSLAGSAVPLRHTDGTPAGAVLVSRDVTDGQAVEAALRKSEERYRGIVAALSEGITIQDANGVVVEANASAERLLGLRVEDMRGRTSDTTAWGAVDEQGLPLPGERHAPMVALRTGEPQTHQVMGIDRAGGGGRLWLSVNAQPLFRPGTSERVGVVSSFFDITPLREAEEERTRLLALATAGEEQFRTLADTMPVLAWYAEPDGFISWYNRRWHEYTGKPLDEQAGWQWESVHDPHDLPRVVAKWKASIASGEAFEDQFRLKGSDGVFRWFLTRIEPLHDRTGRVVRWFGTNVDIDDQKRAERSLRLLAEAGTVLGASSELAATLTNVVRLAVPALGEWSAVFLADEDGEPRFAAAAHADAAQEAMLERALRENASGALGTAMQEVVRKGASHVVVARGGSAFMGGADEALRMQASVIAPIRVPGRTLGVLVVAASGGGATYEAEEVALIEELGRRVGASIDAVRLLDLTQRERRRAEEANRAKDEFLSVASHELRTPLNAILGWSRLLRTGAVREERRDQALATIERNARAQVQLVEDILDVSRIITGKLRLDLSPVEPAQIVDAAMDVVRPAADAKSVRIDALVDPETGTFMGDAGRLQQVLWNLLANAVKFTPTGGHVQVRVERRGGHVEIAVTDSGKGIDPKFLPYIFEPFRQADGSSTRVHGGLGLGLAIVKHVVELHGGLVDARSEGAGRGATLTVRLPVTAPPEEAFGAARALVDSKASPGLSCPPELEGVRVLVVDDEEDARELLRAVLEGCGVVVRTAASVTEALDAFRREPPDAILSDVGMAEQDGYSLIRAIRALPPGAGGRVPAVAITAYARAEDRARALMEGFTTHLAKPVDPQELLLVLAAALASA